jgi:hypothetical protein
MLGVGGCQVPDGNRDMSLTSPLGKTSGEPNGSFESPIIAVFESDGVARLQGTVSSGGDLDVFYLGEMNRGDRVVVDVDTPSSQLDSSIALFDGAERIAYTNDDIEGSVNIDLDSFVDWIVRHEDSYFLVVTHSAFAGSGRHVGSYRVDVTVTSGSAVPEPIPQVLLLQFDGGPVESPVLGSMTLAAFDGGDISIAYEGQTGSIKAAIIETMEQNYERFDVTILTSDDRTPDTGTRFSTIFFGGFRRSTFGLAEDVDLYNADRCDDAIIFAESFQPHVFSQTPSAEELGVAIGNIAAHESGHLLGLNHVMDDMDLMDDVSPADAFLFDQEFITSPLSSDIMSIGVQDSPLLLFDAVGAKK